MARIEQPANSFLLRRRHAPDARRVRELGTAGGGVDRRELSAGAVGAAASIAGAAPDRGPLSQRRRPTPRVRQQRDRLDRRRCPKTAVGGRPGPLGAGHRGEGRLLAAPVEGAGADPRRAGREGGGPGNGAPPADPPGASTQADGDRVVAHHASPPSDRVRRHRPWTTPLRRDADGRRVAEASSSALEASPPVGGDHGPGAPERPSRTALHRRHPAGEAPSAAPSRPPLLTRTRPQ
jgi:hypothetical protein